MFGIKKGNKSKNKKKLWHWKKRPDEEVFADDAEVESGVNQSSANSLVGEKKEHSPIAIANNESEKKRGFFSRLKLGLSKTQSSLVQGLTTLFIGKKEIDDELLDDLESHLLLSDLGVEATQQIISALSERLKYSQLDDANSLTSALKEVLYEILQPVDQPLKIERRECPFVILVVGVNGAGKTTTIGKLARLYQKQGLKVMLAAGDTFRAAAVEQLQNWGERFQIPVVAQPTHSDSASVVFDAFHSAKAKNMDVLIADTAGRLHNKEHLMMELEKVKRVLKKIDPDAPHETMLVLDAGTGQNAISQTRIFYETLNLTGLAVTKLDGTAKGGIVFALSKNFNLPIRFLGVGEKVDDLRPFDAKEFIGALFAEK